MKKISLFIAALFIACTFSFAQNKPLNGSGKIIYKTFAYNQFDKIELVGLNGKVNVTVGKPFSVQIAIDDNLADMLAEKETNGKLIIELTGNKNNKLYLEKNNISINISMPEISVLQNGTNCNVAVNNIVGRYFRIENFSNGSASLSGSIDKLDIKKKGNGNINARELKAKSGTIAVSGNGNIKINATENFSVSGFGNGDVINIGPGKMRAGSRIFGNGRVITKSGQQSESPN